MIKDFSKETDLLAEAQERRTDSSGNGHAAADIAAILRRCRLGLKSSARPDAAAGGRAARPSQGNWRHRGVGQSEEWQPRLLCESLMVL